MVLLSWWIVSSISRQRLFYHSLSSILNHSHLLEVSFTDWYMFLCSYSVLGALDSESPEGCRSRKKFISNKPGLEESHSLYMRVKPPVWVEEIHIRKELWRFLGRTGHRWWASRWEELLLWAGPQRTSVHSPCYLPCIGFGGKDKIRETFFTFSTTQDQRNFLVLILSHTLNAFWVGFVNF